MSSESDRDLTVAEQIDAIFKPFSDAVNAIIFYKVEIAGVGLPIVVVWLIVAAIALTMLLKFINLRGFGHALALTAGRGPDRSGAPGVQLARMSSPAR